MIKKIKSKKGNSILSFIVVIPFLVLMMTYFICSFTFNRTNNDFYAVTNSYFDRILVEGQITTSLMNDMTDKLERMGFDRADVEITANNGNVDDGDDSTYLQRGEEIQVKILHKKPHYFYLVNQILSLGAVNEEAFYVGSVFTGMSEKWD